MFEQNKCADFRVFVGYAQVFMSTWQTTVPDQVIFLPLPQNNWTIDWGNGILFNYSSATPSNTYGVVGIYNIQIFGIVRGFNFGTFPTSREQIMNVQAWGGFTVDANSTGAFQTCVNLQVNAMDQPVIEPGALSVTVDKNNDLGMFV